MNRPSGDLDVEVKAAHGEIVPQPVTRGGFSADELSRGGCRTHLGTDCGQAGSGMWHSLAGLMDERDTCLDLARCFPFVRAEFQPSCIGAAVRAQGAGSLKLELKSADERVLWWATQDLAPGDDWQELAFSWEAADLRRVKSLCWAAEPGAQLRVDSIELGIQMPKLPFEQEIFLLSYAKLARLYSQNDGTVRERALQPAGKRDSVAAGGLFCLATCVACKMGLVKLAQAEQILHKVQASTSDLQRAKGLLPRFIRSEGGKYRIHEGSEYGTFDTSLYYHSLLLAAQLLWDGKTLAGIIKAVREIDFDNLRDADGYVLTGLHEDGQKPLERAWRDWGGEAALVLLLEQMATGTVRQLGLEGAATVQGGVGLSAEVESLFYADFGTKEVDAVTGVDWLAARRAHLSEQKGYFPRKWPKSAAARLGLYGLSVGEDADSEGYAVSGTRGAGKTELIRPYYLLMSGLVERHPVVVYHVLRTMRDSGLIPPWGIVGGFDKDLAYAPLVGSLTAGLECIAAYHLWARATGVVDHIYEAVEDCGLLREAVRVFYPLLRSW